MEEKKRGFFQVEKINEACTAQKLGAAFPLVQCWASFTDEAVPIVGYQYWPPVVNQLHIYAFIHGGGNEILDMNLLSTIILS